MASDEVINYQLRNSFFVSLKIFKGRMLKTQITLSVFLKVSLDIQLSHQATHLCGGLFMAKQIKTIILN